MRHEQWRVNASRGPWQLFARAPLLMRDKDLSQPATRVDTTCWQLFRPAINTAHFCTFLFFVAEVMSNYLTTDGLKKISLLPEAPLRPEARGICHICHMVNPALATKDNPYLHLADRRETIAQLLYAVVSR